MKLFTIITIIISSIIPGIRAQRGGFSFIEDAVADVLEGIVENIVNEEFLEITILENVTLEESVGDFNITAGFSGIVYKADEYDIEIEINEIGTTTKANGTFTVLVPQISVEDLHLELSSDDGSYDVTDVSADIGFESITFRVRIEAAVELSIFAPPTVDLTCVEVTDVDFGGAFLETPLPSLTEDPIVQIIDGLSGKPIFEDVVINATNMILEGQGFGCEL